MTQYRYGAAIHPTRQALHDSLVKAHFGHLSLDELILTNRIGLDADFAIVREGIEYDIVAQSEAEDDSDMQDAVTVLGALDETLFRNAFEELLGDRYFEAEAA